MGLLFMHNPWPALLSKILRGRKSIPAFKADAFAPHYDFTERQKSKLSGEFSRRLVTPELLRGKALQHEREKGISTWNEASTRKGESVSSPVFLVRGCVGAS